MLHLSTILCCCLEAPGWIGGGGPVQLPPNFKWNWNQTNVDLSAPVNSVSPVPFPATAPAPAGPAFPAYPDYYKYFRGNYPSYRAPEVNRYDPVKPVAAQKPAELTAAERWRKCVLSDEIDKQTQRADLIVVGKPVSGARSGMRRFEISTIMKGTRRIRGSGPRLLDVAPPGSTARILDEKADYLLFLTEHGMLVDEVPCYPALRDSYSMVVADDEALLMVRTAMYCETASRTPLPAILMEIKCPTGDYAKYATQFEKAASDHCTLLGRRFAHSPPEAFADGSLRDLGAKYVLQLDFHFRIDAGVRVLLTAYDASNAEEELLRREVDINANDDVVTLATEVLTELLARQ